MLEAVLLGLAGSLLGLLAAAGFTSGIMAGLGESIQHGYPVGLAATCLAAGPLLATLAAVVPALRVSRGPVARTLLAE